ncbi:MAG: YeiH family putative sulfate export transporter, partial [Odoribacter splanchnicus]
TMAMTALGAETSIEKFKKAGVKPFLLASFLYIWLLAGGYLLVRYITPYFV